MIKKNIDRLFDNRVKFVQSFVVLVVAILVVYLFGIQVFDIRHFKGTSHRTKKVFVLRGEIIDRNGFKLATDVTSYNLYAIKQDFDHTPEEIAEFLAPLLNTTKKQLVEKLKQNKKIILLKKGVDRKTANEIRAKHFRELALDSTDKRVYPQGILASHVLGYYNPNADIASGVEQTARAHLEDGGEEYTYEKTGDGKIVFNLMTDPKIFSQPLKGKTLKLTIDSAIQHVCEKALFKKVQETNALRGAAIVTDPKTGEILAFAVYPYYDPNEYNKYSPTNLKNWAIADVYPPGSTFKIITVSSGFISGKINKYSKILDTGKMKVGWWTITNHDYKKIPYPGSIDLAYLFKHSSNVASAKIAQMIPREEYYDILRMFNFGSKTGIDLPGESSGLLRDWKKWGVSDQASMGYGYGSSVTAIQMVSAIGTLANKGVWVTPHVIKYEDEEEEQKIVKRRVMEEAQAREIVDILVKSVDDNKLEKMNGFSLAAKTGTSQKPLENGKGYSKNKLYTSTIGFLPASDPKVLIYVVIDSAQGGGIWGSTVALPVFKEIALEVTKILNIAPDRQGET